MILPFIEQANLFEQADFDIYWNEAGGSPNRAVSSTYLPAFVCPTDPNGGGKITDNSGPTSYALSAGPAATWHLRNYQNPGMFSRQSSVRIRDVKDGTTNTVMCSEVQIGDFANIPGSTKSWKNSSAGSLTSVGTNHNRRFNNSQANITRIFDYHANCLAGTATQPEDDQAGRFWASGRSHWGPWFNTLMPPNTPYNCDNDRSVTTMDIKSASSWHTGGVQVTLADGSVKFVSENIDHGTWIAVGSKNDGETIGEW